MIAPAVRRPIALVAAASIAIAGASCRPDARNARPGAAPDAGEPSRETVTLATDDGWSLAATWIPAGRSRVVILVHQLGSDRSEWSPLIDTLVHEPRPVRPSVLAIDLRGHGESTRGPSGPTTFGAFASDPAQWSALVRDVRSALEFATRMRPGAPVVVAGSAIGGSAALQAVVDAPSVAGVALLSPGVGYRGIDTPAPMERALAAGMAVFLAAGARDTASSGALALLAQFDRRGRVTRTVVPDSERHGVALALDVPRLWPDLAAWMLGAERVAVTRDGGSGAGAERERPVLDTVRDAR